MHLKLAPPLEVVEPPRQWFSFRRCSGRVDAYLNDSESPHHGQHLQSYNNAPLFSTRAEARAWCREFAARKGIPYAEARSTSSTPTTTERNQREAQNIAAIMGRLDSEAIRVQTAGEFERAAELWIRGAAHCRELVKLWPGRAREISAGGAARLKNARYCVDRAYTQVVALAARPAFAVLPRAT